MNLDKHKFINYLLFIIAVSLFWTCSPELSYGVSLQTIKTNTKEILVSTIQKNEFNLHPPYLERDCASCHDRNNMGKTKLPFETLHGPVASNNCIQCHTPHQSKLKNLLVASSKKLCLSCHNSKQVSENKIHKDIKETSCTKCHNPHGGNNRMSLQSESCYKCHDNYKKEYKFLHGPVDSGNCFQCHGTHKTKAPKLLINSGDNLCLSCHNSKDIIKTEYHIDIKNNKCIECHNPHGGKNDKFLLNKQ